MILAKSTRTMAREMWASAVGTVGDVRAALEAALDGAPDPDTRALMELAFATLPLADVGGPAITAAAGYAAHALWLRRHSPYCRDLPEELFLHFVWYPRVNSEDLTDCRRFFFDRLRPVVEGLGEEDAVLAVNRWCGEHMTYRASDERTESPLTAYHGGIGRCGEESVFLVTALRSVGIAARQVYVPWWAHCDDNHAWVEAWAGGRWRYLGACEPEQVLDRGWFTAAAARAPMVHYRTFFDCAADPPAGREGCARLYAVTDRYARTYPLDVTVLDGTGAPVSGAEVTASVVNMAAFRPVLTLHTDDAGRISSRLGAGTYRLEAGKDGLYAGMDAVLGGGGGPLSLALAPLAEGAWQADYAPAPPDPHAGSRLAPDLRAKAEEVRAACAERRAQRAAAWARDEYAAAGEPWSGWFAAAAGNAGQLWRFYQAHEGPERDMAAQLIASLTEKDLRDVTFETLEEHLRLAMPYAGGEMFREGVLCPRLGMERLAPWREALRAATPPTLLEGEARWLPAFIRWRYSDGGGCWYPPLWAAPAAMLAMGRADTRGQAVMLAATLRAYGVPARLDRNRNAVERWRDGAWRPVSPEPMGRLELTAPAGPPPRCGADWSLARREGDRWRLWEMETDYRPALPAGFWRLTTARRLPDGGQLVSVREFLLEPDRTLTLPLTVREPAPGQMRADIPLEPFALADEAGRPVSSAELAPAIWIWPGPAGEPREHLLTELTALPAGRLVLVLRREEELRGPDMAALRRAWPGARVVYDRDGAGEELARRLFLEPDVWPLLAVMADGGSRFACAGYFTGAAALAADIAGG